MLSAEKSGDAQFHRYLLYQKLTNTVLFSGGVLNRNHLALMLFVAGVLSGLPAGRLCAQTLAGDRIEITSFDWTKWPNIPFDFNVYCNNVQQYTYDAVRVYENGKQKVLSVTCKENYFHRNLGFIVDASGSQEAHIRGLREGLRYFISTKLFGRSYIATFAEEWRLLVEETGNKAELLVGVDSIRTFGYTRLWEGVDSCLNASQGTVKEAVLITDGIINGGENYAYRVVEKAKRMYVRLHVLSLGSRGSMKDTLHMAAEKTGGKFMHVPGGFSPTAFVSSLGTFLQGLEVDTVCAYQYASDCPDGQRREVRIEVDVCGRTLSVITHYFPPHDPMIPYVTVAIGSDSLFYGQSQRVPVTITDVWQPNTISELDLRIRIPDAYEVTNVITDGCALDGIPNAAINIIGSQVNVKSPTDIPIQPVTETLFFIEMQVSEKLEEASTDAIDFISAYMRLDHCVLFRTKPGTLDGLKKGHPSLQCDMDFIHVRWIREEARYEPEEFDVRAVITNPTPIPISNPFATISLPAGIELLDGPETRPLGDGPLIGEEEVSFRVRALPSQTLQTLNVCIESGGDSTDVRRCCTAALVETATPYLETWCTMPDSLRWDPERAAYIPEDFPVTVYVVNKGKINAENVELSISVPEACMLRSWYRPDVPLSPAVLYPGDTGRYTWKVVPMGRPEDETIEIRTQVAVMGDTYENVCTIFAPAGMPRSELACGGARSLYYNDTTQTYSPDLFAVSADVTNTSRLPVFNVMARIILPPFLHLQPGEGPAQLLDIDPFWPGITRKVHWLLYADGPPIKDAAVCLEISAPDLPADTCCISISTRNTLTALPELICSLDLPESIRYIEGGYEPNPVPVHVTITNTGDTTASMIYVALHQGADLSLAPGENALKLAATSLDLERHTTTSFNVEVRDRSVSRWDTLRVSAYCENGGAVVCEKPVWIEAVRAPQLALACSGPESLVFDDATLSYVPSPFQVYLTATNEGNAPADSIVVEYLAAPGVELVSGEGAVKILAPQRLEVDEYGTASWTVAVLPHAAAATDTLHLQAIAAGSPAARAKACPLAVHVPAMRTPELSATCEPPSAVVVEGRRYLPDPLTFRLHLASTGTAAIFDVEAEAIVSSRLLLASGDQRIKTVARLDALSGATTFEWEFHPVPSTLGDTVQVTFRAGGRFLSDVYCTAKLYLPPVPPRTGTLEMTCAGPDTVRGDEVSRLYPNPVNVRSFITNTGNEIVDTLVATLHLPSGIEFASGETGVRTLTQVFPAETRSVDWQLHAIEDTSTVLRECLVRIHAASERDVQFCDVPIVVAPFSTAGRKAFALSCSVPDTIRYDAETQALNPAIFPFSVTVVNTGVEPLEHVIASLVYPGRFLLVDGESAQQPVAALLEPGHSVKVQWLLSAVLRPTGGTAECTVSVSAVSVVERHCSTATLVEGHQPSVTVEVSSGNLTGYTQVARVPVYIQNTGGVSFSEFQHIVTFDPLAVSLAGVANQETLLRFWSPPSITAVSPGVVALHFSGEPPVSGSGVLYYLLFAGASDAEYGPFDVVTTEIEISGPDRLEGMAVTYIGGDITTSGSCVIPLDAGAGFVLDQNTPNPFNPVTTITYRIPVLKTGVETSIHVLDVYGRTIRRYHEGVRNGGTFSVEFDASGMESGIYFYRLRAGNRIQTKKMVYMK